MVHHKIFDFVFLRYTVTLFMFHVNTFAETLTQCYVHDVYVCNKCSQVMFFGDSKTRETLRSYLTMLKKIRLPEERTEQITFESAIRKQLQDLLPSQTPQQSDFILEKLCDTSVMSKFLSLRVSIHRNIMHLYRLLYNAVREFNMMGSSIMIASLQPSLALATCASVMHDCKSVICEYKTALSTITNALQKNRHVSCEELERLIVEEKIQGYFQPRQLLVIPLRCTTEHFLGVVWNFWRKNPTGDYNLALSDSLISNT